VTPHAGRARIDPLSRLTAQERECLRLVAEQRSSKEIAQALGISKASVDTYCNRARAKLGVDSRREAARMVVRALEGEPSSSSSSSGAAAAEALAPSPAPTRPAAPIEEAAAIAPRRPSPVAGLGPVSRLALILVGAGVFALSFGALVNGLERLNAVMATSHFEQAPSTH
jgi:DNA-binding CsgD family transcriptional regulator